MDIYCALSYIFFLKNEIMFEEIIKNYMVSMNYELCTENFEENLHLSIFIYFFKLNFSSFDKIICGELIVFVFPANQFASAKKYY